MPYVNCSHHMPRRQHRFNLIIRLIINLVLGIDQSDFTFFLYYYDVMFSNYIEIRSSLLECNILSYLVLGSIIKFLSLRFYFILPAISGTAAAPPPPTALFQSYPGDLASSHV